MMNTYVKFCPNVFVVKTALEYKKGDVIEVATKYGLGHDVVIWNLVGKKNECFYYSVTRADGMTIQDFAKRKAERLAGYALNAAKKSNAHFDASNKNAGFLSLGEPIKIGHHSQKRHEAAFESANNNMRKSVEFGEKAAGYESRMEYWCSKSEQIDLSMPDCIEYYEAKLEKAQAYHAGLKDGSIPRGHSMALQYANKALKDAASNLIFANRLWGEKEVNKS